MAGPWEKYQAQTATLAPGQLEAGNINLNARPVVHNADGTISTVRSMSANFDGREVLLPTVSDDGRILSDDEAIDLYRRTGRNLGVFDTPEHATAYAQDLHNQQAAQYAPQEQGPWTRYARQAPADFSGVAGSVDSTASEPKAGPYAGSAFNRVVNFFAGPAPIQGDTLDERRADYQSRPAALRATVGVGQSVDSLVRGVGQLTGTSTPAMGEASRDTNQLIAGDLPTAGGRFASDLALTALPGGAASKLPSLGARIAANSGLGAGFGALQAEDAPGQRLTNTIVGGAFGAGGELVGAALRAAGSKLTPEVVALYNAARQRGIELTPAQLSNSQFLIRAQNMLKNLPFNGATRAFEKQVDQFNQALSKTFGENTPKITPDIFAAAKSRIGAQFDELSAKSDLRISDRLLEDLGALQQEAAAVGEEGTIRAVTSMVDRVLKQTKDGVLPGAAYKSLDSQLGKIMANGGEKAAFIGQMRDSIRSAMDESIPAGLKDAWTTARSQYRSLKTVEPLVAKSADGTISPAALMGRVTADKAGKASMASGRSGELGELARIGQAIKSPTSSGTAENLLAGGVFNPVNWPSYVAGATLGTLGGRALTSNKLAQLMVESRIRPAVFNELARLAGPGGVAVRPAVTPVAAPIEPDPRRRDNGR